MRVKLDVGQPEDHEHNNGWRWSVAWSVALVFFLIHWGPLGRKSFPAGFKLMPEDAEGKPDSPTIQEGGGKGQDRLGKQTSQRT